MRIPFNFMSSFLVGDPSEGDFTVSYLDYIKSQLQFNVLAEKKSRDLNLYLKAYDHIEGRGSHSEEYSIVLSYFYEDLSDLLVTRIKSGNLNFRLRFMVEDPSGKLPILSVDLGDIEKQLGKVLDNESDDLLIAGILSKFSIEEMGTLKTSKHLALASVLYDVSVDKILIKVEPEWEGE